MGNGTDRDAGMEAGQEVWTGESRSPFLFLRFRADPVPSLRSFLINNTSRRLSLARFSDIEGELQGWLHEDEAGTAQQ